MRQISSAWNVRRGEEQQWGGGIILKMKKVMSSREIEETIEMFSLMGDISQLSSVQIAPTNTKTEYKNLTFLHEGHDVYESCPIHYRIHSW